MARQLKHTSFRVTVEDEATLITPNLSVGPVLIRNTDAAASVYLGGPDVTVANGIELKAGELFNAEGNPFFGLAPLYAITASGTAVVGVLGNVVVSS